MLPTGGAEPEFQRRVDRPAGGVQEAGPQDHPWQF